MKKILFLFILLPCLLYSNDYLKKFEIDSIKTSKGELKIVFLGHASLVFLTGDKVIYIDPVSSYADFSKMPQADLILITHEHFDHLDINAINYISKENTIFILNNNSYKMLKKGIVLSNYQKTNFFNIVIEGFPAYNIINKRPDGQPFHPVGSGNGYILTIDDLKFYIAGDTENIQEMKLLTNIYCAFLPCNLPYTMSIDMFIDAADKIKPKLLYPYHYGDTDLTKLQKAFSKFKNIELRIRKMK